MTVGVSLWVAPDALAAAARDMTTVSSEVVKAVFEAATRVLDHSAELFVLAIHRHVAIQLFGILRAALLVQRASIAGKALGLFEILAPQFLVDRRSEFCTCNKRCSRG